MERKNRGMSNKTNLIYLNNAATTWPKPEEVLAAAQRAAEGPYLEHGRTTLKDVPDYLEEARRTLAYLFRTPDPDQYVFTTNATDSLNILLHGFAAAEGAPFHVITTAFEHNSVIRPLHYLESRGLITYSVIEPELPSGNIHPEAVTEAIRPETRLAVFSHAGNVIGSVQDVRGICSVCREEEIFTVIDGAQSAGQVPVDLRRIGCDAFVFTGHKYLFGIPGTGGFYLGEPDRIVPVRQGGTGQDSGSPIQPEEMPRRFEAGTPNFPGIAALQAGASFVQRTGLSRIETHTHAMIRFIQQRLSGMDGITLLHADPKTPLLSFMHDNIPPDDFGYMLARVYSVITRSGLHCAPWIHNRLTGGEGAVRISLSYLNTMDECRVACDAIEEICNSG